MEMDDIVGGAAVGMVVWTLVSLLLLMTYGTYLVIFEAQSSSHILDLLMLTSAWTGFIAGIITIILEEWRIIT